MESFGRNREGQLTVTVRLESDIQADEGRRVTFNPADYKNFQHAYASTVHKAQGQGKEKVYHLADTGMADRQLSLVAFTRTKRAYKLYGADAYLDSNFLGERMGTDRLKANALDARKPKIAAHPAPSIRERAAEVWKLVMQRIRGQHIQRERAREMKHRVAV